jgi:hypothetical protein
MKVLKIFFLVLIIGILFFSCKHEDKFDGKSYSAEFRGYAKEYMSGLKSVLMKNMKEGGPLKAVSVCSDTASDLTRIYSAKLKIKIKRISYKNRNIKNFPDKFEKEALNKFAELYSQNELNTETEIIKKVNVNGKEVVRYIKPIIIEAPCLNCHGDREILPEVSERIKQKYPNDKATGYKIGDLRGAISITKEI